MRAMLAVLIVLLASEPSRAQVLAGADVLAADGFAALRGRKVALITNHTGRDRAGRRLVDMLHEAPEVQLVRLFSPEHGLYGVLDEKVGHGVDEATGLPVYSLYGETRRPTSEMLEGVDTLVFDIQDIGTRFYTYISTMGLCMEEAAKHRLRFVVLDRPNPITGRLIDGPIADEAHFGFTAYGPIPLVHGMTVGELAGLFNAERGIGCDLQVIACRGWRRSMWFDETGLTWINPSPNMRNPTQALLYPAVGLIEASNVSVGRGCDEPFEMLGAPWIDGVRLAAALNAAGLPGVRFVPIEFTPRASKFAGQACRGVHLTLTDRDAFAPARTGVTIAWTLRQLFGGAFEHDKVLRLLQSRSAQDAWLSALDPAGVPAVWKAPLDAFRSARQRHLIYPE